MAYVVVKDPDSGIVKSALTHILKMYGEMPHVDNFLRDFLMRTRKSDLAEKVELAFETMSEEERNKHLKNADAYSIINDYVNLRKPIYRGIRDKK